MDAKDSAARQSVGDADAEAGGIGKGTHSASYGGSFVLRQADCGRKTQEDYGILRAQGPFLALRLVGPGCWQSYETRVTTAQSWRSRVASQKATGSTTTLPANVHRRVHIKKPKLAATERASLLLQLHLDLRIPICCDCRHFSQSCFCPSPATPRNEHQSTEPK